MLSNMTKIVILLYLAINRKGGSLSKFVYPEISISEDELCAIVERLVSTDRPRNYQNLDTLVEVSEYIFDCFVKAGGNAEFQDLGVDIDAYRNVICRLGPTDAPKLVIGAHYDSCADTPGADDNATGIAGLISLVQLLKPYESGLKFQIEFVAFTLEEPPFFRTEGMGSYVHAKSLHDAKADVVGMICFEMIGFFTDEENSQAYPLAPMKLLYTSVGNFIALVSNFSSRSFCNKVDSHFKASTINARKLYAPTSLSGVDFSDHRNYWKFDYPAVMVTDTAFYRNPNYHKITDTVETLDFGRMKEVIRGVFYAVLNF